PDKPVEFEVLVEIDGKLWRYELACIKERVVREALYKRVERFAPVFVREWNTEKNGYHIKDKNFGFPAAEAEKASNQRPNASLISIAAQHGTPLAEHLASAFMQLQSNINAMGRVHMSHDALVDAAALFAKHSSVKDKMIALLTSWDLGLSGIELR